MKRFVLVFWLFASVCFAQTNVTDWGTISVTNPTTISFEQYDITKNFTDQYTFAIQSGTDTTYAVTVFFDVCRYGCGNPDLSYGIYTSTGQLLSDTGSAVLTSGTYYFQVKGTGMGAGNSVDYFGTMQFVSAVPEPEPLVLFAVGSTLVILMIRRRKKDKYMIS